MEIIEELNSGEYDNKNGKAKERGDRNKMLEKYDKSVLKALSQESMKAYNYIVRKVPNKNVIILFLLSIINVKLR